MSSTQIRFFPPGIQGGLVNVPSAGTRVRLPNIPCREITIIARKTNTGSIYVGGPDVSSSKFGAELEARDSITLPVNNANMIYIDAEYSREGISYVTL